MIENTTAKPDILADNDTRIKVYDFMKVGTQPEVKYIEDVIKGKDGDNTTTGEDGKVIYKPWEYENGNSYYWTKTGTHTFFGYLTKDPEGYTFAGTTSMSGKVLTVGGSVDGKLPLTPSSTPQFDFLYSNIITRDAADPDQHGYIDLDMHHLFTALAVKVVNNTNIALTNLNVQFIGVYPTQSATIDWGTPDPEDNTLPTVGYQKPATTSPMDLGTLSIDQPTAGSTITKDLYSGYALLWPQDILPAVAATEATEGTEATPAFAGSQISITYNGKAARTVSLSKLKNSVDNTPITKFEAGKKYLLTITVKPLEVIFNIQVNELSNMNDPENDDYDDSETFYVES